MIPVGHRQHMSSACVLLGMPCQVAARSMHPARQQGPSKSGPVAHTLHTPKFPYPDEGRLPHTRLATESPGRVARRGFRCHSDANHFESPDADSLTPRTRAARRTRRRRHQTSPHANKHQRVTKAGTERHATSRRRAWPEGQCVYLVPQSAKSRLSAGNPLTGPAGEAVRSGNWKRLGFEETGNKQIIIARIRSLRPRIARVALRRIIHPSILDESRPLLCIMIGMRPGNPRTFQVPRCSAAGRRTGSGTGPWPHASSSRAVLSSPPPSPLRTTPAFERQHARNYTPRADPRCLCLAYLSLCLSGSVRALGGAELAHALAPRTRTRTVRAQAGPHYRRASTRHVIIQRVLFAQAGWPWCMPALARACHGVRCSLLAARCRCSLRARVASCRGVACHGMAPLPSSFLEDEAPIALLLAARNARRSPSRRERALPVGCE
ncbi:hypothetical protein GGX14DRAFT_699230 [Mycena pura]|uniref:Uncharacterized protein n=1 Tax=Mycena pura TaxID=153505 RepID=A0AAD6V4J8_9AGAR|nr:hypothetical protein GGX14DRAFT_699230 [Mycena pura]